VSDIGTRRSFVNGDCGVRSEWFGHLMAHEAAKDLLFFRRFSFAAFPSLSPLSAVPLLRCP